MKKLGKVIGCFGPLVAALLCQVAASLSFSLIYGLYAGVKMAMLGITDTAEQELYLAESLTDANVLLVITAFATIGTLVLGVLWYRAHKPKTDFALKEVVNGKLIIAMVCLGVSLQFIVSMCLNAVYPLLPQSITNQYNELMESLMGGNVLLSMFVTVILAPLAEELLFRGITLKKAQKIMPFMAANVLQAVLFGIYHMNLIQGVYAFVLGMILGFTAEYFHSIWASILLHACVNAAAEILVILPEAVTNTIAGVAGVAAVGVVLLFVAAKLYPKARTESVAEVLNEFPENDLFR